MFLDSTIKYFFFLTNQTSTSFKNLVNYLAFVFNSLLLESNLNEAPRPRNLSIICYHFERINKKNYKSSSKHNYM